MRVDGYLVVRADGTMRITKKRVRLALDEVAFPLSVDIPATWGRVQADRIDVSLPPPPKARVTLGKADMDTEKAAGAPTPPATKRGPNA